MLRDRSEQGGKRRIPNQNNVVTEARHQELDFPQRETERPARERRTRVRDVFDFDSFPGLERGLSSRHIRSNDMAIMA